MAGKSIKWLYISNLQFSIHSPKSVASDFQKSSLQFLEESGIRPDYLFITDDSKYSAVKTEKPSHEQEKAKENMLSYIRDVARTLGIDFDNRIFLFPGNPDSDRGDATSDLIRNIIQVDGAISSAVWLKAFEITFGSFDDKHNLMPCMVFCELVEDAVVTAEVFYYDLDTVSSNQWMPFDDVNKKLNQVLDRQVVAGARAFESIPEKPVSFYKSRKEAEAKLRTLIRKAKNPLIIIADGGIGKSELCRKIYDSVQHRGVAGIRTVAWVYYLSEGLSASFMTTFFDEVAKYMQEAGNDKVKALETYFDSMGSNLLLFIDNANDMTEAELDWLASLPCKFVITTRKAPKSTIDKSRGTVCYLSPLDHKTQKAILIEITKGFTENAQMADNDLESIIAATNNNLHELKPRAAHAFSDKPEALSESVSMSLVEILEESLRGADKSLIELLQVLSMIAPIPITRKQLISLVGKKRYDSATDTLVDRGWLTRRGKPYRFDLHPAIAEIVRDALPPEPALLEMLGRAFAMILLLDGDIMDKRRVIPHVFEHAEYCSLTGNLSLGVYYFEAVAMGIAIVASDDRALVYRQKVISLCEAIFGENYPETARGYNDLGIAHSRNGDYELGMGYLRKSLQIYLAVFGENHSETAKSYGNIGSVCLSLGNHAQALENLRKALQIYKTILGENYPETAGIYRGLGIAYNGLGDNDRALECLWKSQQIYETVLGENHLDTAEIYDSLGSFYNNIGDYRQALECYQKALRIYEVLLGENHPDTAQCYNSCGTVCNSIGDNRQALKFFYKALQIRVAVLGENHHDTVRSYNHVGLVCISLGYYEEAMECFQKALRICESNFGENHPDTAFCYNNIGGVHDKIGNYELAIAYFRKAVLIDEAVFGENHLDVATGYHNIGGICLKLGNYPNALAFLLKGLKSFMLLLGSQHSQTILSRDLLRTCYSHLALPDSFEAWLQEQLRE